MLGRCSVRRTLKSSTGPKPTASYALLDFADEGTAIVRVSKIVEGSISDGRCRVKWHDGKEYDGDLAFTGTYKDCVLKQKQLEEEESDEEDLNEDKELESGGEKESSGEKELSGEELVSKEEKLSGEKELSGEELSREKELSRKKELSGEKGSSGEELDKQPEKKRKRKQLKLQSSAHEKEESSGKRRPKRKTKELKVDDNVKNKKKKLNDDKVDKENKKKDIGSLKDEFIVHVTELPPSSRQQLQDVTNVDLVDDAWKDEDNLDDSARADDEVDYGNLDDSARTDDEVDYTISKTIVLSDDYSDKADVGGDIVTCLKAEIHQLNNEQACRFDQIMGRIKGIEDQLKLLFSSGIATALSTPPHNSAVTFTHQLAPTSWPAVTTHQLAVATNQPAVAINQPAVATNQPAVATNQPAVATNQLATYNVDEDLINPSTLCPILMKHKTRRSLAAALVNELVDTETRIRSNVRGRGKDKLDDKIIEFVKRKCFEMFPSDKDSDIKKDWEDCIVSIDDKGRELKRKLKRQQEKQ